MNWIKKHWLLLMIGMGFLLACKSCQSCQRQRTIEYNGIKYEQTIDSMKLAQDSIARELTIANDSIKVLNVKLNELSAKYNLVSTTLEQTQQTNNSLVNSNNKLVNQINK